MTYYSPRLFPASVPRVRGGGYGRAGAAVIAGHTGRDGPRCLRFVADGLLSRADRRARIVAVTPAGRSAVRKAQAIVAGMYARILSPLPAPDREVFLRSLIALVAGPLAQPSHVERPARRRRARASRRVPGPLLKRQ